MTSVWPTWWCAGAIWWRANRGTVPYKLWLRLRPSDRIRIGRLRQETAIRLLRNPAAYDLFLVESETTKR